MITEKTVKYRKFVKGLLKSGHIMREEWTNWQKEVFAVLSELEKHSGELMHVTCLNFPLYYDPFVYELNHMAMGIAGESGEFLDAFKKHLIYRKELDTANIVEELGDLFFYLVGYESILAEGWPEELFIIEGHLEELCRLFNLTREFCEEQNMLKLSTRYKDKKFTNEAAIKREDKNVDPESATGF